MKTLLIIAFLFLQSALTCFSQTGCISGNCQDGQGIFIWKDGAKYEGEWKDGKMNGKGKLIQADGSIYIGEYKDDKPNGHGIMNWANGEKYDGEWKDGERDGYGIGVDNNGVVYKGDWRKGSRTGKGTYTQHDGGIYDGEVNNSEPNGYGVFKYPDGSIYEGQWKYGKQNGQGTLYMNNGNKYIGEFKNNDWNGKGTYIWTNGTKYIGEYIDGKRNGQGIVIWPSGDQYNGEWKSDKKCGQGTITWSNGNKYEGEWKDNIPFIKIKNDNSNSIAVLIGNKDYQNTSKVDYALNDVREMKTYLIDVFGYKEGNIFIIENATKSVFETYFGTKDNPEGKLFNNIKPDVSDVFIYYAGHGAPGLSDKKGYFVPVDCDPQYVQQGGYSLDLFYSNLAKLPAKSITVLTDACFSGAEILKNISAITITVSNPIILMKNCVVMSSSTGSQVSTWFNEKQHGMFTYFFLKALQDREKSDKNKDGKLTFNEIFDYISDKTEGIPYYARKLNNIEQTPCIQGTGMDNVFIEYK